MPASLTPPDSSVARQLLQLPLPTESVSSQGPTESATVQVPTDDSAAGQNVLVPIVASVCVVVVILTVLLIALVVVSKW